MIARLFVLVVGLSMSVGAHAQTKKIQDPFKSLKFDLQGVGADKFSGVADSGADCEVTYKQLDSTTLKITMDEEGSEAYSLYVHDGKVTGVEKSIGNDSYENTYKDKARNSVVVTVADDMYFIITLKVGSRKVSCQQDM